MTHRFSRMVGGAARSTSSLLVSLLLASFLVGGGVVPVLHRVHHAQQQYLAEKSAPRCTHGVHRAPAAERGTAQVELTQCWVLARHLLDVPPEPDWQVTPARPERVLAGSVFRNYTSSYEGRFVIRGPPRA